MRLRKILSTFAAIALVFAGVWGSSTAAQAWYNLSITTDTPVVLKNSPTPAMVISVASFTPGPGNTGFSTISIDFRGAGGGNFWLWKNTCTGSGLTLSSCGIASVSIGGVNTTPQAVELSNNREVLMTFAQSYTATTTVVISLDPGALTTPAAIGSAVADVFFGPYSVGNMTDSGSTGIIGISSTVTFHPGAAPGADSTQLGSYSQYLTTNSYSRNGYTFAGWATSSGSNVVAYTDSASYSFINDADLYAVWTPVVSTPSPTPTPTVLSASDASTTPLAQTSAVDPLALEIAAFITLAGIITVVINRRKVHR